MRKCADQIGIGVLDFVEGEKPKNQFFGEQRIKGFREKGE